jgi:DNA integrity scanning protein DisA with diadenylate cyclase activity
MLNLLTLKYWFNLKPESFSSVANIIILSFFGLLLISTIVFFVLKNRKGIYKKLFNKLYEFSFINLIIGLLLFFFSWQQVSFLSARFWYMLWLIIFVVWFIEIIKKSGRISDLKEKRQKRKEFEKYLP